MSDKKPLGKGDALEGELDAWDEMFDALHQEPTASEVPAAVETPALAKMPVLDAVVVDESGDEDWLPPGGPVPTTLEEGSAVPQEAVRAQTVRIASAAEEKLRAAARQQTLSPAPKEEDEFGYAAIEVEEPLALGDTDDSLEGREAEAAAAAAIQEFELGSSGTGIGDQPVLPSFGSIDFELGNAGGQDPLDAAPAIEVAQLELGLPGAAPATAESAKQKTQELFADDEPFALEPESPGHRSLDEFYGESALAAIDDEGSPEVSEPRVGAAAEVSNVVEEVESAGASAGFEDDAAIVTLGSDTGNEEPTRVRSAKSQAVAEEPLPPPDPGPTAESPDPSLGDALDAVLSESVPPSLAEPVLAEPVLAEPVLAESVELIEVDVEPELPPSPFDEVAPELELGELALPELVFLTPPDATENLARDLLDCEVELAAATGERRNALMLEVGRLSLELGDYDRARECLEKAQSEGAVGWACVGLRRVARELGDFDAVCHWLDAEISQASTMERRALEAYRADVLLARGDLDAAGEALSALTEQATSDVRALLASLELAFVRDDWDGVTRTLAALTGTLGDSSFANAGAMAVAARLDTSGHAERAAEYAELARGGTGGVAAAVDGVVRLFRDNDPRVEWQSVIESIAGVDASLLGAAWYRRSVAARIAGKGDEELDALMHAQQSLPYDASVRRTLKRVLEARGDMAGAGSIAAQLADSCAESPEAAGWWCEAGRLEAARFPESAEALTKSLQNVASYYAAAVSLDPTDSYAASAWVGALESAGDVAGSCDVQRHIASACRNPEEALLLRLDVAHRMLAAGQYEQSAAELVALRDSGGDSPLLVRALERALAYAQRFQERAAMLEAAVSANSGIDDMVAATARAARAMEDYANHRLLVESQMDTPEDPVRAQASADMTVGVVRTAYDAWARVTELAPETTAAHLARISLGERLLHRTGVAEPLVDALTSALESAQHSPWGVALALKLSGLHLGRGESGATEGESVVTDALRDAPQNPRLILARTLISASGERWLECVELLIEGARSGDPMGPARLYRAAQFALDLCNDPDMSANLAGEVAAAMPGFAAAAQLEHAGRSKSGSDAPTSTGDSAATAPINFGDRFSERVREGDGLLYGQSNARAAMGAYRKALELHPGDPLVIRGLIVAADEAGELASLKEWFRDDASAATEPNTAVRALEQLDRAGETRDVLEPMWRVVLDQDPSSAAALRRLLAFAIESGESATQTKLLERQVAVVEPGSEQNFLRIELARRLANAGAEDTAVLEQYRAIRRTAPLNRRALVALEAAAQIGEPSEDRVALELAVADYFEDEERARAAFISLAGDTYQSLGERSRAMELYRAAVELVPGFAPALTGWRYCAVVDAAWGDVAEAAEREADAEVESARKASLHHLAAVARMDREADHELAALALQRVLVLDPTHVDAFVRLRHLHSQYDRNDDLVALLERRLDVTDEHADRVALLESLIALGKGRDDDGATIGYARSIIDLDDSHRLAWSTIEEVCWEREEWAEAAEALVARARHETDVTVLRDVFLKLGTLYADHMPDVGWATKSFEKVLSYDPRNTVALVRLADLAIAAEDWSRALAATERLIKYERSPDEQVVHLHRAARIYREGVVDDAKAEQAYRLALDAAPKNEDALRALIEYFGAGGDRRSLRVYLDRAAAKLRTTLSKNPLDGDAYRALCRAFAAREEAGVRGSRATARCAAELALLLGAGEEAERELGLEVSRSRPTLNPLASAELDDQLYPRQVSAALREMYHQLSDRIAKHIGQDLRRHGVGRGDKLGGGDPAATVIRDVASALGFHNVDIYVSKDQPTVAVAELTEPVSLILGADLVSPDRPLELRFVAGRALKLARSGLSVAAAMSPEQFGVVTAAIVRQFQPEFVTKGITANQIETEIAAQKKLITPALQQALAPVVVGLSGSGFDFARIHQGIVDAGNRAGLLAGGAVGAAISVMLRQGGYRDLAAATGDAPFMSLLRYAVSEDYAAIRASLSG